MSVLQTLDLVRNLGHALLKIALVFLWRLDPILASWPARKPGTIAPGIATAYACIHRNHLPASYAVKKRSTVLLIPRREPAQPSSRRPPDAVSR